MYVLNSVGSSSCRSSGYNSNPFETDCCSTSTTTTSPDDTVASSVSEAIAGVRLHVQEAIDGGFNSNWFLMPNPKAAFELFDTNHDGYISQNELCDVIDQLGIRKSKQVARRIMRKVDTDRNGFIDFNEFNRFIGKDLIGNESSSSSSSYKRQKRTNSSNSDRTSADVSSTDAYQPKPSLMLSAAAASSTRRHSSDLSATGGISNDPKPRTYLSSAKTRPYLNSITCFEPVEKCLVLMSELTNSIDESSGIQSASSSSFENERYEKHSAIRSSQDVLDKLCSEECNRMTPVTVLSHAFQSRHDLNHFVWRMFKAFDTNNDGYIHRDEIKRRMKFLGLHLSSDEINEMVSVADINHDGLIDFSEFAQMIYHTCV